VHVWGQPCEVEALTEIAARHHLRLLFDAAHAFTCTYRGRAIGNFGDAEVFSFHATKFFNTFEGGAVVTNDDEIARRVRLMGDFGYGASNATEMVGTNGKMSEVHAAMGLTGLEEIQGFIEANRRNHARYSAGLADLNGIVLHAYDSGEQGNYQYVVVEIDEEQFGMSSDRLADVLHAENVLARRYFSPPCHQMEPYRSSPPTGGYKLPHTERLAARVLTFPTGTAVGGDEIDVVCSLIRTAHERSSEIEARLRARLPGAR
jgi:dTDP-4-amino-4,6-dideoxygalactose transaminase